VYTVRRGALAATYRARLLLIGSMNPEEGRLRPQILDRFGLRLMVHGLGRPSERLEAYRRVRNYLANPRAVIAAYADDTFLAREEVLAARRLLPSVALAPEAEQAGLELVRRLKIDSLRAEITMFEAARALAAADGRALATAEDVRAVAPLAVRLRRSPFMVEYFGAQASEEDEIGAALAELIPAPVA
jgi:magnesium chelatase subunit I